MAGYPGNYSQQQQQGSYPSMPLNGQQSYGQSPYPVQQQQSPFGLSQQGSYPGPQARQSAPYGQQTPQFNNQQPPYGQQPYYDAPSGQHVYGAQPQPSGQQPIQQGQSNNSFHQPAPYNQQQQSQGAYNLANGQPQAYVQGNQVNGQQPVIPPQQQTAYYPQPQPGYSTQQNPVYPQGPANSGVVSEEQAQKDIIVLYNAMSGLGTDEDAIIHVLSNRTPAQLQQIANAYQRAYGKSLWKTVDDDTSGDFERLLEALLFPLHQYEARCIHQAISGMGTHDKMLIEILVTQNNQLLNLTKQMYMQAYKKDMMKDVQNDVSGDFGKVVYGMLLGARDETGQFKDVAFDVEALYKAGPGKIGTDEKTIINILTNRSIPHLGQVFHAYQAKYGKPLISHIKSGNAEDALVNLIRYIQDPVLFATEEIEESMSGLGTNEKKLIRLVSKFFHHYDPRNDLRVHIRQRYQQKYGKSLDARISGEVSGDLKKLLVAVVNRV